MPDFGSPNVRRRRLSAELRRLRERAGYNGDQVAERLGWSASKISRIEHGQTGVKLADLDLLLDLYRIGEPRRGELRALAREASKTTPPGSVGLHLPEGHAEFLDMESEAESVWNWEPQIVPGLLQTEGYARAVMHGWHSMFNPPPGDIELRVEARLLRQQQVLQRDPPLLLSVVMDESVLGRRLGDASVMRGQLERIIELSQLPHLELRILPLSGKHPVVTGAFTYIRFPQIHAIPLDDMVTFEHLAGTEFVENKEDAHKYYVAFQTLIESSYEAGESIRQIRQAAKSLT